MRLQVIRLAVALATLASCADTCTAVGGGALRQPALGEGAAMRGPSLSTPDGVTEEAVVGIDWPFEPTILYEFDKETAFVDSDDIESPTNFGSQSEVVITQGTLANRPVMQIPCDVGPSSSNCAYFDGTDLWVDAAIRASLRYLHDGTGVTCYVVAENSNLSATNAHILSTGARTATDTGLAFRNLSSTTDRWQFQISNGTSTFLALPTSGMGLQDQTWGAVISHGTARTSDAYIEWRGVTLSEQANYGGTPAAGDSANALTVGRSASGTIHFTGHLFALACDDSLHDSTMIADTWAAIEARYGVLPLDAESMCFDDDDGASPADLTEQQRARVVRYGMTIDDLTSLPSSHIVDHIEARTGADRDRIVDRLRKIRGSLDRDPDSRVAERVGVIVASADAVRVRDAIVAGLCQPALDEADAVGHAACVEQQSAMTSARLCRVSNGVHVAFGARLPLRAWQVTDVRAALLALDPAPSMVIVRNDETSETWAAALANPGQGLPALRACDG